jgi:hypothetical protein
MTRGPSDLPERLVDGEATDFERRMISALREKKPSASSSARMASALGVSLTATTAAATAGAKAAATASTSALWPWVAASVAVLGLAAAGGVIGTHARHAARPEPPSISAPAAAPAMAAPDPVVPNVTAEPTARPLAPARRVHSSQLRGDLRDQIALIDEARDVLAQGSPQRALETLRRYQTRYPSGGFRPEAAAITIEALVKLGREAEARALAKRFIAEHRGTLLAARVAGLVGLLPAPATP